MSTARQTSGNTADAPEPWVSEPPALSPGTAVAALDALAHPLCVLDAEGRVLGVNRAWRQFAEANFGRANAACTGGDELAAYLATHGLEAGIARVFAAGISEVIRGERAEFTLEYPNHAASQRRWYRATVTASASAEPLRCVVLHEEITQRKGQEAHLRRFSSQLLKVQEEERRHIARELHDSTAQKLAAIIVGLSLLEDELASGDVPKAKRLVAEFLATAEDCARDIRELSHLLHPPLLDELGLEAALDTYVHGLVQRSSLQVTLDVDPHLGSLSKDLALALYRITQECLSNVVQHSGSKTAFVQIARAGDRLILEVRDQGRGIPVTTLAMLRERQAGDGVGFGILGMQERLEEFDGTLEIDASPLGTSVRAFVPQAQEPHEENPHPAC